MRLYPLSVLLSLAVGLPTGCKKQTAVQEPTPFEIEEQESRPALGNEECEAADFPAVEPEPEPEPEPSAEGSPAASEEPQAERDDSAWVTEAVGDVQVLRLFADRFAEQPTARRLLLYHLSRAILAGRNIAFDQTHKDALEIRLLVEQILKSQDASAGPVYDRLQTYHELFCIHGGFYRRDNGEKISPDVTFDQFTRIVQAAHAAGAEVLGRNESLPAMLSHLRRVMFDPERQKVRPDRKRPSLDPDQLNLYQGVDRRQLRGFTEHYPTNSRLLDVDGQLVEEVYRAGDQRQRIPPGLYAQELDRVIRRLHQAIATAPREERLLLGDISEHLRTGEAAPFATALQRYREGAFAVEAILGFIDQSLDPRGVKGVYAGLVGIQDVPTTSKLASLLRQVPYFESQLPCPDACKPRSAQPTLAVGVELVTAAGRLSPLLPFAYRLQVGPPGSDVSKTLLFSNVVEAYRHGVLGSLIKAFVPGPAQAALLGQIRELALLRAALAYVIGPELLASPPESIHRLGLSERPLEELRIQLSALLLFDDPKLVELGLIAGREIGQAGRELAMIEAAALDAVAPAALVDPRLLARRLLVRFAVDEAKAMSLEEKDGQVRMRLAPSGALAGALRQLYDEVSEILCAGDAGKAGAFLARLGTPPRWPARELLGQRIRALGLRPLSAFVLPRLKPLQGGESNRIVDVSMTFSESFSDQLVRLARY